MGCLDKKFEFLKSKMPWYVVQHSGPIAGYKYIKEEWHFKKKPMVVVLNPQGKVQHANAFHLIHTFFISPLKLSHIFLFNLLIFINPCVLVVGIRHIFFLLLSLN